MAGAGGSQVSCVDVVFNGVFKGEEEDVANTEMCRQITNCCPLISTMTTSGSKMTNLLKCSKGNYINNICIDMKFLLSSSGQNCLESSQPMTLAHCNTKTCARSKLGVGKFFFAFVSPPLNSPYIGVRCGLHKQG